MGVKGLWAVIDKSGEPVSDLSALSGERLAVDASIWLYHFAKAVPFGSHHRGGDSHSIMDDGRALVLGASGNDSPLDRRRAILTGLLYRICKLLHYGIRPLFVFDGSPPILKRTTLRARASSRALAEERYVRAARKVVAHQLVLSTVGGGPALSSSEQPLPMSVIDGANSSPSSSSPLFAASDEEDLEIDSEYFAGIDVDGDVFKAFPADVKQHFLLAKRQELLDEQHSRGLLFLPDHLRDSSGDDEDYPSEPCASAVIGESGQAFSTLQIEALVKRRRINERLASVARGDLHHADWEEGPSDEASLQARMSVGSLINQRIASDSARTYSLIKSGPLSSVPTAPLAKAREEASMEAGSGPSVEGEDASFERDFFSSQSESDDCVHAARSSSPPSTESIAVQSRTHHSGEANFIPSKGRHTEERDARDCRLGHAELSAKEEQFGLPAGKDGEQEASRHMDSFATEGEVFVARTGHGDLKTDQTDLQAGHAEPQANYTYPQAGQPALERQIEPPLRDHDEAAVALQVTSTSLPDVATEKATEEFLWRERLLSEANEASSGLEALAKEASALDDDLTDEFRTLLSLFGVPWVRAPGEGEAQCARMQQDGIVDGVISDDSDVLLFGATRVYRHFFSRKACVRYEGEAIVSATRMTRSMVVMLALLLGCDYSIGVRGVGPVRGGRLVRLLASQCPLADATGSSVPSHPDRLDKNLVMHWVRLVAKGLDGGSWEHLGSLPLGSDGGTGSGKDDGTPSLDEEQVKLLRALSRMTADGVFRGNTLSEASCRAVLDAIAEPLVDETFGREDLAFTWPSSLCATDYGRPFRPSGELLSFLQAKLAMSPQACDRLFATLRR